MFFLSTSIFAQRGTDGDDIVIDTTYYYFNDDRLLDEELGRFYYENNRGFDEDGQEILKVGVFEYSLSGAEIEKLELVTLKPTIWLIPGGGFTGIDVVHFSDPSPCSNSLPALLLAQTYQGKTPKVFLIDFYTVTVDFSVFDLMEGCNTLIGYEKYRQQRIALKSFWSLRSIINLRVNNPSFNIDTDNMIMAGHSAGAFLTLMYNFLDQSEIASLNPLCTYQPSWPTGVTFANTCDIPNSWITGNWPIAEMKGYMPISGGSLYNNIFLNNPAKLGTNAPKLYLVHGTCDELINQGADFVPHRCCIFPYNGGINNVPGPPLYTRDKPNASSLYNTVYGSSWIYQLLYGEPSVRLEQVCEGGHNPHAPEISRPFSNDLSIQKK